MGTVAREIETIRITWTAPRVTTRTMKGAVTVTTTLIIIAFTLSSLPSLLFSCLLLFSSHCPCISILYLLFAPQCPYLLIVSWNLKCMFIYTIVAVVLFVVMSLTLYLYPCPSAPPPSTPRAIHPLLLYSPPCCHDFFPLRNLPVITLLNYSPL